MNDEERYRIPEDLENWIISHNSEPENDQSRTAHGFIRNTTGTFTPQHNVAYSAHSSHNENFDSSVNMQYPLTSRSGWYPTASASRVNMERVPAIWQNDRNHFGIRAPQPCTPHGYESRSQFEATSAAPPRYNSRHSMAALQGERRPDNEGASMQRLSTSSAVKSASWHSSEDASSSNVTAHPTLTGSGHLQVPQSLPSTSRVAMAETMQAYGSRTPLGTLSQESNTAYGYDYASMNQYGVPSAPLLGYNSRHSMTALQGGRRPDNEQAPTKRAWTPSASLTAQWRPYEDASRSNVFANATQTGSSPFPAPPFSLDTSLVAMDSALREYNPRVAAGSRKEQCEDMQPVDYGNAHHCKQPSGEQCHVFEISQKSFKWKHVLASHRLEHTANKPHHCGICDKTFSGKRNLMKHGRIHTGEKPYRCKICGKSFSQKSNLNTHGRIHTGEKPHRCNRCGQSFAQKHHLETHRHIHRRQDLEVPGMHEVLRTTERLSCAPTHS
ncbi:uncharacterized protein LOC119180764 isoform X2 [Rhipicephalus microplus]|uniref:uncharacterized protein LOC119180764 isoform X2 n=1 Tax=Rhipicephalus microplus TaxID=6941 RepID=UPI003F6C391A